MGDLPAIAVALGLPADASPSEILARAEAAGRALALLPEAGAAPSPQGGHGDVLLDLAATLGDHQSELRGVLLARRAVGVARYGQPLRYESRVDWGREVLHELVDGAAYARGWGRAGLSGRLLGLAWRVVCRTSARGGV